MTDDATAAPAAQPARPPSRRSRQVLAGVALVLACLTILVSTVAVWVHEVAFKTDRFTALVSSVISDPVVIDPLAQRISVQVVDALDVQTRIEDRLPDIAKPLAAPLTIQIQEALDRRLQTALANPKVQAGLEKTIAFTHERIMNLLRGDSNAISVVDGYVTIEVWPVVGAALDELQSIGLIPADVQLPDLSDPQPPGILSGRLAAALGVSLPSDFGTITLMPADRLLAYQSYVRAFDMIVVVLIILSVVLVALALWLATRRRRMVLFLAIGTLVAFLLARLAIGAIEDAVVSGISDGDLAGAIRAMVDATVTDLRGVTSVIVIATIIVAAVAYFWGRPRWVGQVAAVAGDAAGRAGASVGAAAGSAAGSAADAVSGAAPSTATVSQAVTENRASIERAGLALIAFVVLWLAVGLDIALLAAALFVGFELIMRALSQRSDRDDDGPAAPSPES
jgi:hypothetical protein